jgi:hypothetical protein
VNYLRLAFDTPERQTMFATRVLPLLDQAAPLGADSG